MPDADVDDTRRDNEQTERGAARRAEGGPAASGLPLHRKMKHVNARSTHAPRTRYRTATAAVDGGRGPGPRGRLDGGSRGSLHTSLHVACTFRTKLHTTGSSTSARARESGSVLCDLARCRWARAAHSSGRQRLRAAQQVRRAGSRPGGRMGPCQYRVRYTLNRLRYPS